MSDFQKGDWVRLLGENDEILQVETVEGPYLYFRDDQGLSSIHKNYAVLVCRYKMPTARADEFLRWLDGPPEQAPWRYARGAFVIAA